MFSWKTLGFNDDLINLMKVLLVSASLFEIAALIEYCHHILRPGKNGSCICEE